MDHVIKWDEWLAEMKSIDVVFMLTILMLGPEVPTAYKGKNRLIQVINRHPWEKSNNLQQTEINLIAKIRL